MPQLIPAIHIFVGSTRLSVKPKFLRLLGANASTFGVVEFRHDTPSNVMRNQIHQLISTWWARCSRVAGALPLRLIADSACIHNAFQAVVEVASTGEVCSVPIVFQIFAASEETSDIVTWKPLLEACQNSGRFQSFHIFLLSLTFKSIILESRHSSLLAFVIALFALTHVREEPDVPWFHETWSAGNRVWLVSAQSLLAPNLHHLAEHLIDSYIFANLWPTFSPQITSCIHGACRNQAPMSRLTEAPVHATNPVATRQFYLNERLGPLLIRLGDGSTTLEQLRTQFDSIAATAAPAIREALEDIAIEIARLVANPPSMPSDLDVAARHPLEEVFSVDQQQFSSEIATATEPLVEFFPVPIPLYFQDIVATTLQSRLQGLRSSAVSALSTCINGHFRDAALTRHFGWLNPSLNQATRWQVMAGALGAGGLPNSIHAFIHLPQALQRDFFEEITAIPSTISFSQFIALNS